MTSAEAPQNTGIDGTDELVFLTAPEVAAKLRIGVWSVVALCRSGELPATKPGQKWLIAPSDLQAYIDAGRNTPADQAVPA